MPMTCRDSVRSAVALAASLTVALAGVGLSSGPASPTVGSPRAERISPASVNVAPHGRVPLTQETFADPPASVRPGTRWWWDSLALSSSFSRKDALEEVDSFAKAGFGRFEIAWASAAYGTAEQQADLEAVARRAAKHGMQVDMTLGPGWPWAAPTTTGELGQQELMYGRIDVTGPSRFSGEVAPAIGDQEPRGDLVAVTAAKVVERGPAVTQTGSPPSESTILAPASLVDLTARVDGRQLNWHVPEGEWIIFSFWQRNREGNHVSLISEKSVRAGLKYVDRNQLGAAEEAVRKVGHSFFEDSLELNADELYWTPTLPSEFSERRGYEMAKYLPLMFVQGVSDYWVPQQEPTPDFELPGSEGARYRYDYYATITDLYLDNHVKVVGNWAEKYGMQFRTQPAYGNNFEVIRSAREAAESGVLVDDESLNAGDTPFLVSPNNAPSQLPREYYSNPETDQWRFAMDHYRQVTSGSHQGGGLEITSELGAWFGRELATSLREYKRMMDKEWAAGLTRPLLHGVTHSPEGTPWPGASHFVGLVGEAINHRTWPQWQHFRPLSDYWARGALVLQQGRPRTDVAILRDNFVTTAAGTDTVRPFFQAKRLERQGYTIGYVDPTGVRQASTGARGELFPDGPSYDVLVVDGSQFYVDNGRLPGATARAIDRASAKGLHVVFVGRLPRRGLSGADRAAEDRLVRRSVRSILARPTTAHVRRQTDVAAALEGLRVLPAVHWSKPAPIYSQMRETKDAHLYYLWNATGKRQRLTGTFTADGAPTELDLWGGDFEPVVEYRHGHGTVMVPLNLAPHEATVLMFEKDERRRHIDRSDVDRLRWIDDRSAKVQDDRGGAHTVVLSNGRRRSVDLPTIAEDPIVVGAVDTGGLWLLQVTTYGPEGTIERPAVPLPVLADWRTIPSLTAESGIGTYTTTLRVPQRWVGDQRGSALDLGRFEGTVQVFVNGRLVSHDIDPQARLDVTGLLTPGDNALKIVLATTPFNKAVASPTTALTRPGWPASLTSGMQPYGLLGPVRLVPYARGVVSLLG